jgi:phage terminase large subunit-like protein
MNLWVDAPTVWIPDDIYMACADYKSLDELEGECWLALDLASVADLTCLHLYLPNINYYKPFFFCPKETALAREKNDGVPYTQWADEGWLILTDGGGGKRTDYNHIKQFIRAIPPKLEIKSIAFDRWNSSQMVIDLTDEGYNMVAYAQTLANMSYPTKEFEKDILSNDSRHDGNPCMQWMIKNVALITDGNDNIKIDKKKSNEKVDGPVSAVMAKGQHLIDCAEPEEEYFFA